ncbi:tetratricopeptide repeat protein [Chloroflexi bacterium TSY]|nr:tetratricopeptide repeat protein [Chloroflexi bacterium TSY]
MTNSLSGRWNRVDQYRFREVIDLVTRTTERTTSARLWNQLGYAKNQLGDKREAIDHYQAGLDCTEEEALRATILNNMGSVYDDLGEKQEALRFYNLALPLRRQVEDVWGESVTRYNLAMAYCALGRLAEAVVELEQVVAIDEAVGHPDLESDRAALAQVRALLAEEG